MVGFLILLTILIFWDLIWAVISGATVITFSLIGWGMWVLLILWIFNEILT